MALAACLSQTGASRLIFELAAAQEWELVVSRWVLREMRENLADLPLSATRVWLDLKNQLVVEDDELTFDWPLLFHVTKDKPVLCTALACADVVLTFGQAHVCACVRIHARACACALARSYCTRIC